MTFDPFKELGIDAKALAEWNKRHMFRPPEPDEDVVPGSIRAEIVALYQRWYDAGFPRDVDFREVMDL